MNLEKVNVEHFWAFWGEKRQQFGDRSYVSQKQILSINISYYLQFQFSPISRF
jgi:hypothetical protein